MDHMRLLSLEEGEVNSPRFYYFWVIDKGNQTIFFSFKPYFNYSFYCLVSHYQLTSWSYHGNNNPVNTSNVLDVICITSCVNVYHNLQVLVTYAINRDTRILPSKQMLDVYIGKFFKKQYYAIWPKMKKITCQFFSLQNYEMTLVTPCSQCIHIGSNYFKHSFSYTILQCELYQDPCKGKLVADSLIQLL